MILVQVNEMINDQISKFRNRLLNLLKQMLKDPVQQYGHLFSAAQQCTASLNLAGVPSVSQLEGRCHLDFRVCDRFSDRPSHPTIGHRHQGNLRLMSLLNFSCLSRSENSVVSQW